MASGIGITVLATEKPKGTPVTPCNYGKRALAYIIDVLFLVIPGIALALVGTPLLFADSSRGAGFAFLFIAAIWWMLADFGNHVIKQGISGQTIGKGSLKIKLIRADTGKPLGVGLAFVRWLIIVVFSFMTGGLYLLADLIAPAFTEKNQRITDKMLSSIVVDTVNYDRPDPAVFSATTPPPPPPLQPPSTNDPFS